MSATALSPCFLMPFLTVIWVNVTSTASLCMSRIKHFCFPPVMVVNWVPYVSTKNLILRRSTPFPALALLRLVFVFSRFLVSRFPASVYLSYWFVSISYGCSMSSSSIIFLGLHFQWWRLLGHFGIDFRWYSYLDHSPCMMGAHLHMSLLQWFIHLLNFQWFHHRARLHVLKIFHLLQFVYCCICLLLGYMGSNEKLDTPW